MGSEELRKARLKRSSAAAKKKREERIKAGLCKHCNSPAVPGKTRCQKHLDLHSKDATARRDDRRDSGGCTVCGIPCEGKVCEIHLRKSRDSHLKRVEKGGCTFCRQPRAFPSAYCLDCYFRKAARMNLGLSGEAVREMGVELRKMFEAQEGLCALSGIPMVPGESASLDHIVPTSKGGTNDLSNLRWLLRAVNDLKGDRTDEEVRTIALMITQRSGPGVRG